MVFVAMQSNIIVLIQILYSIVICYFKSCKKRVSLYISITLLLRQTINRFKPNTVDHFNSDLVGCKVWLMVYMISCVYNGLNCIICSISHTLGKGKVGQFYIRAAPIYQLLRMGIIPDSLITFVKITAP